MWVWGIKNGKPVGLPVDFSKSVFEFNTLNVIYCGIE